MDTLHVHPLPQVQLRHLHLVFVHLLDSSTPEDVLHLQSLPQVQLVQVHLGFEHLLNSFC